MGSRLPGSPTLDTLGCFAVVFAIQQALQLAAPALVVDLFLLSMPLDVRPWTLVTSVYAHGGVWHLVSNSAALVVFGLLVERVTTRMRFHAFFVTVGAASGAIHVALAGLVGPAPAVLGASGAVFGLFGYLVTGNALAESMLGRLELPPALQVAIAVAFAVVVTLSTAAPRVALVAHFAGLVIGLVAGRLRLLHVTD